MKYSISSACCALLASFLLFSGCAPSIPPRPRQTAARPDKTDAEKTSADKTAAEEREMAEEAAAEPAESPDKPEEPAEKPAAEPAPKPERSDAETTEQPAKPELIPRQKLFGNPDKTQARLSPNGALLSYLAPVDGVLNVWVGKPDAPDEAKPVTQDDNRGIHEYFWAYTNKHILYLQDQGGDEDFHVYSVNLASGETKDLTPLKKIAAQIEELSERAPDEILVGLNDRDPAFHDLYRINLKTGERTLAQKNTDFAGFVTDHDLRVRFAHKMTPDGGTQYYRADGDAEGGWKEFQKIDVADSLTTAPLGFDKSNEQLYMLDSRGRDTGALKVLNLKTGGENLLAADDRCDVGQVLSHPTEKNVQAVSFDYERTKWKVLDPAIKDDMEYLESVADGEIQIPSRTLDDKKWIVAYLMDDGPVRYFLYDRDKAEAHFLFSNRSSLEGLPLVNVAPKIITARDGLKLVCYLSLPKDIEVDGDGAPTTPLPLVIDVHGGPWARESWGFNPEWQLLANRGYAVLSVNFRGSTGFGKAFLNAGIKQWGRKMHDDLIDAVDWAVEKKIADPKRVAVTGGSYGGYATLAALTMTPDKFACGVDIVGPSNLVTLLNSVPPYWGPSLQMFKDRVGDHTTEEGRKLLEERSPLNFVDKIERPLLIGQGANDPRVKQSESDQIVEAMRKKKIPVTYVLFPDEGHGFERPENDLAFYAVTEAFLARHLGGKCEPIGEAFHGSSITVPSGVADVPGLNEALKQHAAEEKTAEEKPDTGKEKPAGPEVKPTATK